MSGRTRWRRPDGEWVTGFRKTTRRRERRDPEQAGDWKLTMMLPSRISAFLNPGQQHGIITVKEHGRIEAAHRDKAYLLEQVAGFLGKIASRQEFTATASLTRGDEPGPTLRGPVRRGFRVSHEFVVVQAPCVVLAQPADAPVIYPMGR